MRVNGSMSPKILTISDILTARIFVLEGAALLKTPKEKRPEMISGR
jgi:hypothetical protein